MTAPADHIEQTAGFWLERQDFGGLTPEEQDVFAAWLAESVFHRVAYVRLRAAWSRTERLAALRAPMREAEPAQLKKTGPGLLRHAVAFGAFASAVTAAAIFFWASPEGAVYRTAVGDREIISLADGSHVELNTDTVLSAQVDAKRRIITLEKGEAYLDIKHDESRPFVINAHHYKITDLGTKFTVRTKADRLEVSLFEGSARIEAIDPAFGAQPIVLKPGDMAIAHADRIAVVKKSKHQIVEELGWRRGVLVFDNTTLADAVTELNRYNRQQLVISDPSIARLTIVGTFPATDLELVLAAAEDVYGLHVSHDGNTIHIHR